MTTYLIDAENSITALDSQQADFEGEIFASEQELAGLAGNWPAGRLIEVWNGIPGLTPVKKFSSRKSAVSRIWKAIQSLDGGGSEAGTASPDPPRKAAAKTADKPAKAPKPAKKLREAPKTKPSGKGKRAKAASKPTATRDGSKKAEVLALLQRKNGATLSEIMKADLSQPW